MCDSTPGLANSPETPPVPITLRQVITRYDDEYNQLHPTTPREPLQSDATSEATWQTLKDAHAQETFKRYLGNKPTLEKARSLDLCGKGSLIIPITSQQRITVVPMKCKSWRCPTCGPMLARFWANRIVGARPKRFLTLTADPKIHVTPQSMYVAMKAAIPRLIRLLRLRRIRIQYVLVWELHKNGFPHCHLLQKGDYIPKELLKSLWLHLGMGCQTDIRVVREVKEAAFYVAKYVTKAVAALATDVHITRTIQASTGFFDRQLFKASPPDVRTEGIIHSRDHFATIVERLVEYHGFQLAEVDGLAAFALAPPIGMTWIDTMALLQKVL